MNEIFSPRPLAEALAAPGPAETRHHLRRLATLPAETVTIPPLILGAPSLANREVRECAEGITWRETSYRSAAPSVCTMSDVLVHSHAGIVLYDRIAIAETLAHTAPALHAYTNVAAGIIPDAAPPTTVPGCWVSALAGANANYFHNVIDCIGRLATLTEADWRQADGILIPQGCPAVPELLDLLGITLPRREVAPAETLRVERLILPGSIHGMLAYHPALIRLFDRIATPPGPPTPPLLYLDRRGAARRQLINENDVVAALTPLGYVPVTLDSLSVAEQARLFRGARAIVGPHGAGFTNLLFARPGTKVLELQMDAYLHWSYRRLAAARGLDYDCVIGLGARPWLPLRPIVHAMIWGVPVAKVAGAA